MTQSKQTKSIFYKALVMVGLLTSVAYSNQAFAQSDEGSRPALVISNQPVPKSILNRAYSKPFQVREITPEELIGRTYYKPSETMVSRKISGLRSELAILQDKVVVLSDALSKVQRENEGLAAKYYAAIATINTQLQTGTTPGNPRLLERFSTAELTLEELVGRVSGLNQLAIDASKVATESSFLLDSARATYGLSGAIEEDHILLASLEDQINSTIVLIERLLNTVNDDISRTNAYLSSERDNLRTLSLAVSDGNLYGRSLADRPFSGTKNIRKVAASAQQSVDEASRLDAAPTSLRPLVKIRFDRSEVEYEQALYMAVNEALERFPDAGFSVVALHPAQGNVAETAIESTRARRNAQKVLRTMSQIGVPEGRVDLSYDQSADIGSNEVHIFIQ